MIFNNIPQSIEMIDEVWDVVDVVIWVEVLLIDVWLVTINLSTVVIVDVGIDVLVGVVTASKYITLELSKSSSYTADVPNVGGW